MLLYVLATCRAVVPIYIFIYVFEILTLTDLSAAMSNATNSTVSIEDLHNVEQVIIAVVVAAFFLMGMVGNVGILALLWGYKPPVRDYLVLIDRKQHNIEL